MLRLILSSCIKLPRENRLQFTANRCFWTSERCVPILRGIYVVRKRSSQIDAVGTTTRAATFIGFRKWTRF
jgi:hypothetical protein